MEKGVNRADLMSEVRESFCLEDVQAKQLSALTLAYVGDAVYDLVIRSMLVRDGGERPDALHKKASGIVNASAQSASVNRIIGILTEEETRIYKRGRNAHPATMAKNAGMADYRRATGYEALIGYLYLEGRCERMLELIKAGLGE